VCPHEGSFQLTLETFSQIAAGFMTITVDVASHINGLSKNRLLFTAADGSTGHSSRLVEEGDVISIVVGCRTQMVLRTGGGGILHHWSSLHPHRRCKDYGAAGERIVKSRKNRHCVETEEFLGTKKKLTVNVEQ
jgi:hypothetical protein